MAGVFESPKARINASMLTQYVSKPRLVCGRGRLICINTCPCQGKTASVELNEPLEGELSGIVEVVGMVSNKGTVMASAYNAYRDDKGIPFDLELYNEALKVVHDYPQYYPFQQ
uniref:Replication protein A 14 kDa subunit n=1 Tax=Denticeps clupeoides TaxID=299321 RepID=A0AAY4EQJ2_9TELE